MTEDRDLRRDSPLRTFTDAEASADLRRDYLQNLVHELSTPLTPLLGYLKLFQKGSLGEMTELQRRCIDRMNNSAKRLHRILEDLSYLLQMESGMYEPQPMAMNIGEIVERAVDETRHRADEKAIEVLVEVEADVPVEGDAPRLIDALSHLIWNGVKFNTDGGKLLVRAAVRDDAGRCFVRIEFFDTGIGIAEAIRERVFEPFYQADHSSTRKYGGTGLGLSLSRWIIEAHKGSIQLESPPSIQPEGHFFRGVRAIVELPVAC